MRSCLLALLFILFPVQQTLASNLKNLISDFNAAKGLNKIRLCGQIVTRSVPQEPKLGLEYIEKGIKLSKAQNLPCYQADFLISKGKILSNYYYKPIHRLLANGALETSIEILNEISHDCGFKDIESRKGVALYLLAQNAYYMQHYDLAISNSIRAQMRMSGEQAFEVGALAIESFLMAQMPDEAYQHFNVYFNEAIVDPGVQLSPYQIALKEFAKAKISTYSGEYHQSVKAYFTALNYAESLGKDVFLIKVYLGLAKAHYHMGQYHAALDAYRKVLLITNRKQIIPSQVECMIGEAETHAMLGKPGFAINILNDALALANQHELGPQLPQIYDQLANAYKQNNAPEEALAYIFQRDSIKQNSTDWLREGQHDLYYESNLSDRQRDVMLKDRQIANEKSSTITYMLTALLISVVTLVILFFFFKKNKDHEALERDHIALEEEYMSKSKALENAKEDSINLFKEQDKFAYRMTHEMRGPVARVLGLCQVGLLTDPSNSGVYLEMAEKESHKMDQMLHRFLDVIHVRKGKESPIRANLKEIASKVSASLDNPQNVQIIINTEGAQHVYADSDLLEVIFRSLIENAFMYANPDEAYHYVEISSVRDDYGTRIRFKDNGIGVDSKITTYMFDMFYRGTKESKGLGLGLYAARLAAEQMQGRIIFDGSSAETSFEVHIPFSEKKA